jgi:hypothetical protein
MAEIRVLRPAVEPGPEYSLFGPSEPLRLLIPGAADLDHDRLFGEDVWKLSGHPAWRAKAGAMRSIDFTGLTHRWRTGAKHLVLLQMHPQLAEGRAPGNPMAQTWSRSQEAIKPVTAQANLKMLAHATAILDRYNLTVFDAETWDRVKLLLITPQDKSEKRDGATLSPNTGRGRAQQLRALWEVTHIIDRTDLLGTEPPFDGRETTELYKRKSNRNSVGPDKAVGDLLGFTGWMIDYLLEDIVDTIEWWATNSAQEPPLSQDGLRESMLDVLCEIADAHDGKLPGTTNLNGGLTLAHSALGRLLGQQDADEAYLAGRWAMRQLGGDVTLSLDVTPCPAPITTIETPNGPKTWIRRLLPAKLELDLWQRYLIYACMYYLSATLMLRDSQLSCLPLNAVTTETCDRPGGTTYQRHVLKAYRTKNRHSPVPTAVVVNARVAKMISLLERLQSVLNYQPALAETGQPFLFDQRLAVPYGRDPSIDARDGLYLDLAFVSLMRNAATHLHQRGVIARALIGLKVNMRQVRITCAQAYASREHGAALAAAYGQWDTRQVAAGYVGDVYKRLITPIDPADVEEALLVSKGRTLVTAKRERATMTGRGLPRLDEALQRSAPKLENPAPVTPARLRALGKQNRNIHQGTLNLCLWQLEGAMCGGRTGPDFAKCAPGQCRNSVMTLTDRARYELRRRQYLTPDTPAGRRGAAKLDELNPDIKPEFADRSDEELSDLLRQQYEEWVTATLGAEA